MKKWWYYLKILSEIYKALKGIIQVRRINTDHLLNFYQEKYLKKTNALICNFYAIFWCFNAGAFFGFLRFLLK